jgi:hypothetical protein
MNKRRSARRRSRQRDLVIVAAAIEGVDRAHPALLAEHIASDSPLVSAMSRQHLLTHDEEGDADE